MRKADCKARDGDLIFADPTFAVKHNTNGFLGYNEKIFSWGDQERLAQSLREASERGAKILITNADHASIHELYNFANIRILDRKSVLSGIPEHSGSTAEALIGRNLNT